MELPKRGVQNAECGVAQRPETPASEVREADSGPVESGKQKVESRNLDSSGSAEIRNPCPAIPDHELLRRVGKGAYGEVWLARSALGAYRAVKIVYRASFPDERPYEREFRGIQKFEPISRTHDSQVDILHVG